MTKKPCCSKHGLFVCENEETLLAGNDDPQQQIEQYARDAAGDEGNDHRKPEPERADPKEFTESTTDACQDAMAPGTTQTLFLMCSHFLTPMSP